MQTFLQKIIFSLALLLNSFAFISDTAPAQPRRGTASDLGGTITRDPVEVGAVIHSDYSLSGNFGSDGFIIISAALNSKLRAVLKLELERLIYTSGQFVTQTVDLNKFIEEAYIELRNHDGKLAAVVVGKHPIYLGTHGSRMPNAHNSPTHGTTEIQEVFGVTLTFRDVGFFDLIETSVFESQGGDLAIGAINGTAIQLTKDITESLSLILSAAQVRRENTEQLVTLGLIKRSGKWSFYGDFVYRRGHLESVEDHIAHDMEDEIGHGSHTGLGHDHSHWDGNFAATIGMARKIGRGVAAIEVSYIDKTLVQYGIGYTLHINPNLSVGSELRHTCHTGESCNTTALVRVTLRLGSSVGKGDHDHEHGHDHEHEEESGDEPGEEPHDQPGTDNEPGVL